MIHLALPTSLYVALWPPLLREAVKVQSLIGEIPGSGETSEKCGERPWGCAERNPVLIIMHRNEKIESKQPVQREAKRAVLKGFRRPRR